MRNTLHILLSVLLACGVAPRAAHAEDAPLRRVVLISCDTLRAASLSCYGNPGTTTTGIDSLVAAGTLFLNCSTPMGWTLPAHMTMLTGLSPAVTRVGTETPLPTTVPTLPEMLEQAGFVCGAFVTENRWMDPDYGFDRGFRQYRAQRQLATVEHWTRQWNFRDDLTAGASFFLFFHFMDNHTVPVDWDFLLPYWAPEGIHRLRHDLPEPPPRVKLTEDERWDLPAYDPDLLHKAYDSTVYSLDETHLRPLLDHFRRNGLADDTMIILTADHGEEIAEHGGYLHDSPYNEVREVPLIIVWPGVVPAGRTVFDPVSLLDIMPTVADYARLQVDTPLQGLSLRPLLSEPRGEIPPRDFLIDGQRRGLALEPSALVALEDDRWWSLVAMTDTTGCAGTFAPARTAEVLGLYDLDVDPSETMNVMDDHPEVVKTLVRRLDARLAEEAALAAEVHDRYEAEILPMGEDEIRALRALGY